MTSTPIHGDERENLSALFDGELDGDAARFAFKRLGHDAQWREACGRWQLCGDVLRRRAHGAAEPTPGFAAAGFAE
ncbi:sigma-E factor negative regulatory protein, partial [Lysobacter enzymogenes]|uniref:sigma-E factor negative regulatory protein n=1 Tax=Lysobacter enzymogenes TaxID=69 RepID=UPI0019D057D3